MPSSAYQEWLNRNAYRSFPFEENSDFSCESGEFPVGLVLDMRVCSFGLEPIEVRLVSASVGESVSLVFSCHGTEFEASGSASFLSGSKDDVSWRVLISSEYRSFAGEYRLLNPPRLLPSRIVDIPFGVGVDTLRCGEKVAFGEVEVADGYNTTLDIHANDLRLRIGDGDGKGRKCPDYKDNMICEGALLYYFNGQKADSDGNISITGGSGVSVGRGTYLGIPAVIVKTDSSVNSFVYR
jgi:hypothetical protein